MVSIWRPSRDRSSFFPEIPKNRLDDVTLSMGSIHPNANGKKLGGKFKSAKFSIDIAIQSIQKLTWNIVSRVSMSSLRYPKRMKDN
jgi:hypothetical protein